MEVIRAIQTSCTEVGSDTFLAPSARSSVYCHTRYNNELIATGKTRDITVSAGKRAKTGVAGTAELGSAFNDQGTDRNKYYVAVTVDVVPGAVLSIQAHDGGSGSKGRVAFVMYCKDQSGAAKIGVSPTNTGSASRFLKASGQATADWHRNSFDDSAWGYVCQASLVWTCFLGRLYSAHKQGPI